MKFIAVIFLVIVASIAVLSAPQKKALKATAPAKSTEPNLQCFGGGYRYPYYPPYYPPPPV
jgi:hypothetical protein